MTSQSNDEGAGNTARPLFDAAFCAPEGRRFILISAVLASSMGFIDGTVVSIAMPAIRADLSATLTDAQWINNAYMVTLSALILAGGALGDRFGLGRMFSAGIALFMVTSLSCAVAPSPEVLILARFAQGAGAALMVPGSLAIISRAYPRDLRGKAIGTWAAFSALTTALGPIVGGLALSIADDWIWRAIFAINLPMGVLALVLLRRGVRQDNRQSGQKVDWVGALLATAGLGLMAWALISGEDGFDLLAIVLALTGVAAFASFLWHEHLTPAPMIPLGLFRSRLFSAANAVTFLIYFNMSAVLFYLPMFVIAAWDISEIEAAASFAPLSVFIAVLSPRMGGLADKVGAAMLIATGAGIVAVAYVWLALAVGTQNYWLGVLPPMSLMGFGMAFVVAPLSTALMASVGDQQTGVASGVNNAVSRTAGLFAVAAMGPVVAGAYLKAGGTVAYGVASNASGHSVAMAEAFSAMVWIAAALSGIAALVALWMGRPQTGS